MVTENDVSPELIEEMSPEVPCEGCEHAGSYGVAKYIINGKCSKDNTLSNTATTACPKHKDMIVKAASFSCQICWSANLPSKHPTLLNIVSI